MNKEELRQSACYTCFHGQKKYRRNYRKKWTGEIYVICWGKSIHGKVIDEIVEDCDKKVVAPQYMERD